MRSLEKVLEEGQDIKVEVSRPEEAYKVNIGAIYGDEEVELNLELDSERELEMLYTRYLENYASDRSAGVFGNSDYMRRKVAENSTWGLAREEEWAVDTLAALDRNLDPEQLSYHDMIDHISTSTLGTITRSQAAEEYPTEDYFFYLDLVQDISHEKKSGGIRNRLKRKAKDKAKDKAVAAATEMKDEVEREYRRMEREGEIDKMKQQIKQGAKKKTKEAARGAWRRSKSKAKSQVHSIMNPDLDRSALEERMKQLIHGRAEEESREVPEPAVKIRRGNVTIYDYRQQDLELEDVTDGEKSEE